MKKQSQGKVLIRQVDCKKSDMSLPDNSDEHQDLNKAIADSLASLNYGDIDDGDENQNKHQQSYEYSGEGGDQPHHDDLDLENAIGDVFNQFDFDNISKEPEEPKQEAKIDDKQPELEPQPEPEGEHNDFDLEAAIGDAFANAFDTKDDEQETIDRQESEKQVEKTNNDDTELERVDIQNDKELEGVDIDNDKELESAIGDAFKSVTDHFKPPEKSDHVEEEDDDLDLDAAIGDAFKSITKPETTPLHPLKHSQISKRPNPTEKLARAIGQAFREEWCFTHENFTPLYATSEKELGRPEDAPEHDDDLKNAIFESFKQILGEEELAAKPTTLDTQRGVEDVLLSTVFKAHNEASKRPSYKPAAENDTSATTKPISSAVQDIVSQMNHQEATSSDNLSVPEDILQELALEITSHLQLIDGEPQEPSQAEEEPATDDKIKAALASAVKQAIGSGSQGQKKDTTTEADLESLQINDIMQNAFDMAMENPQGLLDSLDTQQSKPHPEQQPKLSYPSTTAPVPAPVTEPEPEPVSKLTHPSKTSALDKDNLPKKSLSIAETLALHRSSMFNGSKELPTLANGKLTNPSTNPHLSQVLSTLSSHIHSNNGSDSNILQVIRQMTDALSSQTQRGQSRSLLSLTLSTTSPSHGAPSADEITSQYIDKSSKDGMIRSLTMAKKYLEGATGALSVTDTPKAVSLVDKVIDMFAGGSVYDVANVSLPKMEEMTSLNDSIISSIYNYSTSRFKTSFIGDKPSADSPEYKERIRLENRERKKKWREGNAERNKDNDLRSRVIKRANTMFSEDSHEKKAWIEEEFAKRREKRMAKQKKDGELLVLLRDHLIDDSDEGKTPGQKHELSRPVSDIFNVLSLTGLKEDPKVALAAASAAAAAASLVHSKESDVSIASSILSIMSSVFDSALASGQGERVKNLYKAAQSFQLLPKEPKPPILSLLNLNLEKRKPVEVLQSLTKRQKSTSPPVTDEEAKATTTSAQLWNSVNALKMPSYKRPESETTPPVKVEGPKPALLLSKASPFISNKSGFVSLKDAQTGTDSGSSTLKRPGSFQRPAYSKPKGRNMGFPPLYSTSFELT